ncbi:hypothetical protein WQ54_26830 [Bacillus sp. SA1-12]|uniref:DUF47 domain-containing protein n=1 Tax=Bacillus sp. SA1-12 TaxID=1455638 RepID=UPI000627084E|nr:DUF47 family protein [Bacillus sp. SA1-12]KKI89188.1 hypothetical protein WQ54_26830 [Bacillus sp. SA1-12]
MFFFRGKKDKLSVLLVQMTENLQEAAQFFLEQELTNHAELQQFVKSIKQYEKVGDGYVETMMKELNHTYITVIDREDILQLVVCLDNVLDEMNHCAGLLDMYSITKPTEQMKKFSQKIYDAVIEISHAVELLSRRKLSAITPYSIRIKELEANTNNLLRMAIKQLFATTRDPIKIMQCKEVYESLEGIVNECRSVAITLDSIIMKNS